MSKVGLALGFLWLLGLAPAVQAGTITIEFELSESSISILGGIIEVPPDGSIRDESTVLLRIPGAGISSPARGTATLANFDWSFTFNATNRTLYPGIQFTFSGYAFVRLLGEATGTLTGGFANLLFLDPARQSFGAFIDCTPRALCNYAGDYFPASTGGTDVTPVGILRVGGLDRPGQATLGMTSSFSGYFTARIVGREVERFFTPEPSRGLLALAGLATVAGLGLRRRLLRSAR